MSRSAEAREWWADLDDVRVRIEQRHAREGTAVRGVRDVKPAPHLTLVRTSAPGAQVPRRRPRMRMAQRVGPRPDMIASWAFALGLLLVFVAVLSRQW